MYSEKERMSLLSTLWIFVLFNMVYADILGMLKPGYVDQLNTLSQELSTTTILFFSVMMEVVIIMVIGARYFPYKCNRIAHFIAVPLSILWVVVPAFMPSLGPTPISYIFFATIEVITMLVILGYVIRWPKHTENSQEEI